MHWDMRAGFVERQEGEAGWKNIGGFEFFRVWYRGPFAFFFFPNSGEIHITSN